MLMDANPNPSLEQDLRTLRAAFHERGFYERPLAGPLCIFIGNLALRTAALWLALAAHSPGLQVGALLISALASVAMATLGHTASHHALSRARLWNRLVFYFTYPFILQVSARYWRHSHVVVHHPAPNIVGLDDDCDLRPLFAINEQHRAEAPRWQRWGWRMQGLTVLLLLPANGLNIQRHGWAWLLHELTDSKLRSPEAWLDLACLLGHLAVFLLLPMAFFPAKGVLLVYLLHYSLLGIVLFAILAPGHFPSESVCLDRRQRHQGDFYLRQTATTLNFRTGRVGRWLCSGLEYQIEHHLFPGISHVHFRKMSPLVQELCRRHGLPYRTLGWGEAIWKSYLVFLRPKPVVALSDLAVPRGGSLGTDSQCADGSRLSTKGTGGLAGDRARALQRGRELAAAQPVVGGKRRSVHRHAYHQCIPRRSRPK